MAIGTDGGPGASAVSRVVKVFIQEDENVTTHHRKMAERDVKGNMLKIKVVWKCNVEQVRKK